MSNEIDPLAQKIANQIRYAIGECQKLGFSLDNATKIVDEATRQIMEDVKAEVKAGMDAASADAVRKDQERERKYWKGI